MVPKTIAEYRDVIQRVSDFAQHVGDSMRSRPAEASNFVRQCVEATHVVFQKWNVEILYLLGLAERLRFSELKRMLPGISSRTLSLKLAELESQKLVHREVTKDRPVRVDYNLSDEGRTLGRLTVPLVVFLNMRLGLAQELKLAPPTAKAV
jgi:DNA-binding HxlR family transcriptional regulator